MCSVWVRVGALSPSLPRSLAPSLTLSGSRSPSLSGSLRRSPPLSGSLRPSVALRLPLRLSAPPSLPPSLSAPLRLSQALRNGETPSLSAGGLRGGFGLARGSLAPPHRIVSHALRDRSLIVGRYRQPETALRNQPVVILAPVPATGESDPAVVDRSHETGESCQTQKLRYDARISHFVSSTGSAFPLRHPSHYRMGRRLQASSP